MNLKVLQAVLKAFADNPQAIAEIVSAITELLGDVQKLIALIQKYPQLATALQNALKPQQ